MNVLSVDSEAAVSRFSKKFRKIHRKQASLSGRSTILEHKSYFGPILPETAFWRFQLY